jgi:hypothetical protein
MSNDAFAALTPARSNAYLVYAKVLDDIRTVVQGMYMVAYASCTAGLSNFHNRTPRTQRSESRGSGRSNLDHRISTTSQTDRVSKRERERSFVSTSGEKVLVASEESSIEKGIRMVDCPVFKHRLMHGTEPPCQGCSKLVMSQVRSHLNPDRAGTHRGFPSFVQQCQRCKQDFVEEDVYDAHNREGCVPQPQIRNDIVVSWACQYLALYPDSVNIPLPWTDEEGWLTEAEMRRCAPITNSPASGSFLGEGQRRHSCRLQTPPAPINTPDDSGYDCVLGHVLHDIVVPSFIQAPDSSTPMQNYAQQSPINLQPPFSGVLVSNSHAWQNVLLSFQMHQRTIREAATHLTRDQLQYMAREAGEVYNISQGMYDRYASQQTQVQVYPTTASAGPPMEFTTPLSSQYLANCGDGTVTPKASTQLSSHCHHTRSSTHIGPTLTQLSSTSDPRFLTPDLSKDRHRRRTSVPSPIRQDTLYLHRGHSRRSLPDKSAGDERDNCVHGSIRHMSWRCP